MLTPWLRPLVLAGLALLAIARPAAAQWPDRAVSVIHPYGPGTASDATARSIAEAFAAEFGQPFPVVNRDGAAGVVGTRTLATSPADGYTILIGPMTAITSQPHLVRNTGLGPQAVVPVCNVSANLLGIVVRADSPLKNGADVIAAARQRPLNFGSTGRVSLSALAVHKLEAVGGAGQQYVSVPFRSDGASLTETLAGRLDFSTTLIANATPLVRSGELRLIGVFAERRYPDFPNVTTFREQGLDVVQMSYAGIVAPVGTPAPILARLEQGCAAAMRSAPFRRAVEQFGIVVDHRGAADFGRLLQSEYDSIGAVLRGMGMQPE